MEVLFSLCIHSVSYAGLTAYIRTATHTGEFLIRSLAIPDFYCYHDNHDVYTIVSNFLLVTTIMKGKQQIYHWVHKPRTDTKKVKEIAFLTRGMCLYSSQFPHL